MVFRLDGVKIEYLTDKPVTRNPRLIQGLLGVGQVGLLAVGQLITGLQAKKLADVYSSDFLYPGSSIPGVVYGGDGIVELGKDEIYYDDKNDLFLLTGLYQGTNPRGYYDFANALLDMCDEFGIKEIYTLGGFGIGQPVAQPNVRAVLADKNTARLIKGRGVSLEVATASEGSLGVTGLAGLLVPMAMKNGIAAACLLGETHGSYPDPKSAKASLLKLTEILEIKIPTPELDEQIKNMETEMAKLEKEVVKVKEAFEHMQQGEDKKEGGPGDLPYIG
ncbi:MAG: PAC2 family protein [Candidatus Hydrothermarchaeaceae archaeon]